MNIRQKIKKIKSQFPKIKFNKKVSVKDYENYATEIINDNQKKIVWTKAIEKALIENDSVYFPAGKYYVDNSIIVPSNRRIIASKKAEIFLVKDTKVLLFRNADVINGSFRTIKKDEPRSKNIFIKGGIWGEERTERLGYGKSGAFDENDSMHGVTTLMLFSGVDNLSLENMTFKNTAGFAVQIGRTENFVVKNLKFVNCFADGVHINGDVKNGVIYNVFGETEDDLVALNAYDWDNSTINNGPIENVSVSKVFSVGETFHTLRLQTGIMPKDKGGMNCYMRSVYIKKVRGVDTFKMYLQTPSYVDKPDGTLVGEMSDIVIEDVKLIKAVPSDNIFNYKEKDPLTGHFGVFEMGSNIKDVTLKNIDIKLNLTDYPETAHVVMVGPKCCYLKERNLELFDPYIISEVESIRYKNIKVNGKNVDLKDYVKQISFDELYPSTNGFGNGKVKSITRI